MAIFEEIIDKVLIRLSMASGPDTQIYTEERVGMALQHKFDVLFDDVWWPEYLTIGEAMPLDGTTGVVTTTLTDKIKRWIDIRSLFLGTDNDPLPRAPLNVNPQNITSVCVAPNNVADKIFKVMPITTVGTLYATYRTRPTDFVEGDEILLDTGMLIAGTCYDILEDDGSNPPAAAKFQRMFDARYRQFTKNAHNFATRGGRHDNSYLSQWQTQP